MKRDTFIEISSQVTDLLHALSDTSDHTVYITLHHTIHITSFHIISQYIIGYYLSSQSELDKTFVMIMKRLPCKESENKFDERSSRHHITQNYGS